MPTLPTLTINDQTKWDRLLAAFGTAAAYKDWLRTALVREVQDREARKIRIDAEAAADVKITELNGYLDGVN